MSKKIIYLLSLLMALSLVFASCKKNSPTDALGGGNQPPSQGENDQNADRSTGLYPDSESMPNDDEFIRRSKLFNGEVGGNYHRNPVIVAGRDGAVFIFLEKRWERAGAANDVGVDGQGKVDIVYLTSKNSGKDNFNNSVPTTVGKAAETAADSHGAPVVYYIKGSSADATQDKIVVVASAGDGIGRTSTDSSEKNSKIEYIVGKFTSKTEIDWSAGWKVVDINSGNGDNLKNAIKAINSGVSGKNFSQFGTHAEKGFIDSNNKLILPVIMAYQGNNAKEANIYELMGAYILEGTVNDTDVTWVAANNAQKTGYKGTDSPQYAGRLGQWKESHIAPKDVNGSTYEVLVIPSPQGGRQNNNTLGIANGDSVSATSPALPASEGSFGYLLTGKWFGDKAYTADTATGNLTPKNGGSAEERIIYTHVQSQVTKLTLHILTKDRTKVGSYQLGATGKSSSVDMLPDGSVVIAAENTQDGKGYFLYFERYSQAQLARLAK